MLATSFACLALLGAVLLAWQWLAGARFPLDRRFSPAPTASPRASVSILKPVTGADPGTSEAIATWLSQDFPGSTEILFGVASTEDPAFALVEDLLRRFPGAPARLLVCPVGQAPNRKVSKLIHLARASSGRVVVISDADVSVPRDLLSQSVPLLDDPATGLVHCLYRIADAPTAAVRWEALIVNADFWSQVLQNQTFKPLDYALGAVMMLRRDDLVAIGGFEALAEHLADDNRLGKRVVDLGRRTRLSPLVVDCRAGPANWASVWSHQLRWAITIRVCQPWPYFLSILANGTVWPLLWALAARSTPVIWTASCLLAFRIVQALSLESRFTSRPRDWAAAWLVPAKDLLQVALWTTAFLRNRIVWRGVRYRVDKHGHLRPLDTAPVRSLETRPATAASPVGGSGFGIQRGNG